MALQCLLVLCVTILSLCLPFSEPGVGTAGGPALTSEQGSEGCSALCPYLLLRDKTNLRASVQWGSCSALLYLKQNSAFLVGLLGERSPILLSLPAWTVKLAGGMVPADASSLPSLLQGIGTLDSSWGLPSVGLH